MYKPSLNELIDSSIIQKMRELFESKNNMATSIACIDGTIISESTTLSTFCEYLTKNNVRCHGKCIECNKAHALETYNNKKTMYYKCHIGLVDFVSPIFIYDEIYGYIIGGQVATEPLSEKQIHNIADEYNLDYDTLLELSKSIQIIEPKVLDEIMNVIDKMANVIAGIAKSKLDLVEANYQLESMSQMKSDFLANMSHEIRTPMNAIIGMADMALRENLEPDAKSYITQIKRSSKNLLSIINDILDFSKIESGKMDISLVEYSPVNMINDIVNILRTRVCEKNIELIVDFDPDIPGELMGDEGRLKQIITNLANNAIKFTNEGAVTITVSCKNIGVKRYELIVVVKDTGIGIKQHDIEKIFESFQQVDSKRNRNIEGTGLGLAISRNLVHLMGGTIEVSSEYEVGSTFTVRIPQLELREKKPEFVKNKEEAMVACYLENGYVSNQIKKDVERIGGKITFIQNVDEISDIYSRGYKILFTDSHLVNDELISSANAIEDLRVLVLTDYNGEGSFDEMTNTEKFIKPIYSYNLIRFFNNEDINLIIENDIFEIDFVAPDAKVLVVDDNEVNLSVTVGLMKPMKMQIDTALSGMEALNMIEQKHYDIIFMDHMMPQMDGIETTHLIRRFHFDYNNVPIIALTANAMEQAKGMFLTEDMNDFIAKPIDVEILCNILKHWLPDEKIVMLSDEEKKLQNMTEDEEDFVIPGLDMDRALAMLGKKSIYINVLKNYLKSIPRMRSSIIWKYESDDIENYTIEVHALKSSSKQIGAMELGNLAESLENAGNKLDMDYIQKNTPLLIKMYDELEETLKKYIVFEDDKTVTEEALPEKTLIILDEMMEALDNLDSTSMDACIKKLKIYNFSDDEKYMFKALEQASDELDIDTCEMMINQWKKILE